MSDHCRIGSLEIHSLSILFRHLDHCRIGSLENFMTHAEAADLEITAA